MKTLGEVIIIFGFLLTVLNIVERVLLFKEKVMLAKEKAKEKANEPEKVQNEKIDRLETDVERIKLYLSRDNDRIKILEDTQPLVLKSMSALLSHSIDGNNSSEIIEVRKELNAFLIKSVNK